MNDLLLILVILSNLRLLASSRLGACIKWAAWQGILLGLLTITAAWPHPPIQTWVLAIVAASLKGLAFPWLLFRTLRRVQVRREIEPYIGFNLSLGIGLVLLLIAFSLARRLPLPEGLDSEFWIPAAFFSLLTGLLLIVARKTAVMQVIGYLILENGIFAYGAGAARHAPLLLEMGILLDLFVAVFVMGIALFHIARDFDHINVDRLVSLKE
jgi:hydrogenase-4 component E